VRVERDVILQDYYRPFGIRYKGLQLIDVPQTNIAMYFNEASDFIDEALNSGGKILVNCYMGMSRSATCVLAFLMLKRDMTALQALTTVRRRRYDEAIEASIVANVEFFFQ